MIADTLREKAVKRVAQAIRRKISTDEWQTTRKINHLVASRDRKYVDDALMLLDDAGDIEYVVESGKPLFRGKE